MLKSFFYARDKKAEANPSTSWTTCSRALEVWDIHHTVQKLGRFQKDIDRWVWDKEAIETAGLRGPEVDHFNNNEEDEKSDAAATSGAQAQDTAGGERDESHKRAAERPPLQRRRRLLRRPRLQRRQLPQRLQRRRPWSVRRTIRSFDVAGGGCGLAAASV